METERENKLRKQREAVYKYRTKNREQYLERLRKHRENNRELYRKKDREWRKKNKEKFAARRKALRLKNIEKYRAQERASAKRQHKRRLEYKKKYRKLHPEKYRDLNRHNCRKYQALKKKAMPVWADLKEIREKYKEAEKLFKETGIMHHVDHIIPLRGKNVSGLHVHYNLQVITWYENTSKGNRLLEEYL